MQNKLNSVIFMQASVKSSPPPPHLIFFPPDLFHIYIKNNLICISD